MIDDRWTLLITIFIVKSGYQWANFYSSHRRGRTWRRAPRSCHWVAAKRSGLPAVIPWFFHGKIWEQKHGIYLIYSFDVQRNIWRMDIYVYKYIYIYIHIYIYTHLMLKAYLKPNKWDVSSFGVQLNMFNVFQCIFFRWLVYHIMVTKKVVLGDLYSFYTICKKPDISGCTHGSIFLGVLHIPSKSEYIYIHSSIHIYIYIHMYTYIYI